MALAVAPFSAQAETINLYGWQNHSWEFVDEQNNSGTDRSYDQMNSNGGSIGFAASVDTGMDGIKVNVQCEQFTFYNQFADSTASTWCNRNSKIGLAHPQAGEIMFATWLLPYNEGVAPWVDPFYDAGGDSHTNIMGSMGAESSKFYNPVFERTNGFNRRQENIIQYWSPNWNGFVFRFAWTLGNNDETNNTKGASASGGTEIDPVIRSSSLAYTNGPLWLAVTWQEHEDWAAFKSGAMDTSDAESFRVAGRYIMDMGDGVSVQLSAMWEDIEHEFNGVTSVDKAMSAFGFGEFAS
ncbi:MAG: porin, partial [Gammaproteobacteria bacterium]|nr:porin [Gammaproteobacteria bacterium]